MPGYLTKRSGTVQNPKIDSDSTASVDVYNIIITPMPRRDTQTNRGHIACPNITVYL